MSGEQGLVADGHHQHRRDAPGQQRDESGEHRDPRRGAVLRDRTGRDVDVDVARLEQLRIDPEADRERIFTTMLERLRSQATGGGR